MPPFTADLQGALVRHDPIFHRGRGHCRDGPAAWISAAYGENTPVPPAWEIAERACEDGRGAVRVWWLLHREWKRKGRAAALDAAAQLRHGYHPALLHQARHAVHQVRLHAPLRARGPDGVDCDVALPQHRQLHPVREDPQAGVSHPGRADPQGAHQQQRPADLHTRHGRRRCQHLRLGPH